MTAAEFGAWWMYAQSGDGLTARIVERIVEDGRREELATTRAIGICDVALRGIPSWMNPVSPDFMKFEPRKLDTYVVGHEAEIDPDERQSRYSRK